MAMQAMRGCASGARGRWWLWSQLPSQRHPLEKVPNEPADSFHSSQLPALEGAERGNLEVALLRPLVDLCQVCLPFVRLRHPRPGLNLNPPFQVTAEDVRKQQIDCLLGLLRSRAPQLSAPLWPMVLSFRQ